MKPLTLLLAALVSLSTVVSTAAQLAQSTPPTFDVVSIRPNKSGVPDGNIAIRPGGRYTWTNTTLRSLISTAYQRHAFDTRKVEGGPSWLDTERFDIDAKAEAVPAVDPDGFPRHLFTMIQAMLRDRFALQVHEERRDGQIYQLLRARSDGTMGAGLRKVEGDCGAALKKMVQGQRGGGRERGPDCTFGGRGRGELRGNLVTMEMLASVLSGRVGRPVIDRTGLPGNFDIDLEFSPEFDVAPGGDAVSAVADGKPSIFTALQEQLGLRLVSARGPIDVLVVDRAEPLTPN